MFDLDDGFNLIFLCFVLILALIFIPKQAELSKQYEEFNTYLIQSGECISVFRNFSRLGTSKYKGVFLYSGEYYEIDLDINDYIDLGGDFNEE